MTKNEFFRQRIPLYRKDIGLFAKEICNFNPDKWQELVFTDIAGYPKVSVRSGQGVGKTGCEAVIALWFLSCFPYARVVATAPTKHQLNDVLWAEISKWQSKSPLLSSILDWTKTYVSMKGYEQRWFAVARTATKPENMQGFHEDNMLFIVDEASGVSDAIMEAILGTLSGINNKLCIFGNPTKSSGTFYDSHTRDRKLYRCHRVNSMDSPRTNKDNIQALIDKYGADSNVVRVRVYGDFPEAEDDVYIPISLAEKAVNTEIELSDVIGRITLGIDVARFGDDETVITRNVDGVLRIRKARHGQDLMGTVGDIVIQYRKSLEEYPTYKGKVFAVIDDTGLGGGVTDRLREVKREQHLSRLEVVPVGFGEKIPDEEAAKRYYNISTFLWSIVRDLMYEGLLDMEDSADLVGQFSCRKYNMHSTGKIALERKEDMKKRGISSPDYADAAALACFTPKIFNLKNLT